jgi:class 3 adenylate cyclase
VSSQGADANGTFLFTDLVGFTALAAEDGDQRAAEVALEFYDRVRRLLPDHGAEELKTIGDALMLRCSDARSAVLLGLRIIRDLDAVEGFPPVRIGMHTGPAVFRSGEWYGNTVNVAPGSAARPAGARSW